MLTAKQNEVLDFIRDFQRDSRGGTPTMKQFCSHFGWSSANTAKCHVDALVRKGSIVRSNKRYSSASLMLTDGSCCETCGKVL